MVPNSLAKLVKVFKPVSYAGFLHKYQVFKSGQLREANNIKSSDFFCNLFHARCNARCNANSPNVDGAKLEGETSAVPDMYDITRSELKIQQTANKKQTDLPVLVQIKVFACQLLDMSLDFCGLKIAGSGIKNVAMGGAV